MKTTLDCFRMGSLRGSLTGMIGLLTVLGMGLVVPPATYGVTPVLASESEQVPAATGVDIEARLEPQANGSITGDFTFTGNANEVIVIYLESADRYSFPQTLELYGPTGESIPLGYDYPNMLDFQVPEGAHLTVRLPETGEYRLVFLADDSVTYGDGSVGDDTLELSYLLRVRQANYYERLMMIAEARLNQDRYEEALGLFDQAIDDSPERPGAYLARIFTYAEMLYETPEFTAHFDELAFEEDANKLFAAIYEQFTTLESEEQSVIFSDLRQLEQLYAAALAKGEVDEEFDPGLVGGLVEFLQTGVPTEAIRLLFFGTSESVESVESGVEPVESVVEPVESVVESKESGLMLLEPETLSEEVPLVPAE